MPRPSSLANLSVAGNYIEVKSSLELPDLDPDHRLHKILAKTLAKRAIPVRTASATNRSFWNAPHFGLQNVAIFSEAAEEQQHEILLRCSITILEETTTIEKLASCFTAKMALLSKTSEERMFYSLMAAEEVAHFHAMQTYLAEPLGRKFLNYPFALLLNEAIEKGERAAIIYIIQVVLEGWGLTHFRSLADSCTADDLRATYFQMLSDEARHHGSGVVIFETEEPSRQEFDFIIEVLVRLLEMVAVGPSAVIDTLETVLGHLSPKQKAETFVQLNAQAETQGKLNLLKSLMSNNNGLKIVEKLNDYNAFAASTDRRLPSISR